MCFRPVIPDLKSKCRYRSKNGNVSPIRLFEMFKMIDGYPRRRRTELSVSCPCLVFVRKNLVWYLSAVWILPGFPVRCLYIRILSGNFVQNAVRCLFVRTFQSRCCPAFRKKTRKRTRQSCPDFHCPCPPMSGLSEIGDGSLKLPVFSDFCTKL